MGKLTYGNLNITVMDSLVDSVNSFELLVKLLGNNGAISKSKIKQDVLNYSLVGEYLHDGIFQQRDGYLIGNY